MRIDLAQAFYNAAGVTARNDPDHPDSRFAVDRLHERLVRVIRPGMTALDLGCGAGRFTFAMAALGAGCTGIDCAEVPLRHARRIAAQRGSGCVFCRGNVLKLPFGAESFECVLLADTIVEFSPEEMFLLSREVRRVLYPDGLFCVSLKHDAGSCGVRVSQYTVPGRGPFEYHSCPWTVDGVRAALGEQLRFAEGQTLGEGRHWMVFRRESVG